MVAIAPGLTLPAGWVLQDGIPMCPVGWDQRGRVVYQLQPKQYEALRLTPLLRASGEAGPSWIGYGGAAGGGKSHLARVVAFLCAMLWPGSTSIIFRRTEGEVIENHLMQFYKEVPRELWSWNGKLRAITWWNGSRTLLGYLRKDEDVFTYQGNAYDCMIFEEATHYSWFMVQWLTSNRLRSSVDGTQPFALFPSNPGNKGHYWFRRLFIERDYDPDADEQPDDYAFLQARLADNPLFLRRDPGYLRKLNRLDEPWRSWLRDGDWEAGAGAALPMLRREKHLVPRFEIPPHWFCFGAFDWGYSHPFSFGYYATDEDGRIYKCDTIRGRQLQPTEIGQLLRDTMKARGLEQSRLRYVATGPDAFANKGRSIGMDGPSIAEQISAAAGGLPMIEGQPARVQGLTNLREQLAWEGRGPGGKDGEPNLVLMDTPGNRVTWATLTTRVLDEDNPEDVAKTNADAFGRGGDDEYDETKLAVNSRPRRAPADFREEEIRPFAPEVLRHEAEQKARPRPPAHRRRPALILPEGGTI